MSKQITLKDRIDNNVTVIRIRKERTIRTKKNKELEKVIQPIRDRINAIYDQCSNVWKEFGFSLEIEIPIIKDKEITLYLEFGNDKLHLIIGDLDDLTKEFLHLKGKDTIFSAEGSFIPRIESDPFIMKEFLKQLLSGELEKKVTETLIENIEGVWLGYDIIEEEVKSIEDDTNKISEFLKEIV